ncbi:hypothetical protein BBJ28_00025981, partial [Nothophytophthora sp. Chile5]
MILLVILQESLPLQNPTDGWRANYGVWIRAALVSGIVAHSVVVQAKYQIEDVNLSPRQLALLFACVTMGYTAASIAIAAFVVFPIPFMTITMTPIFFLLLVGSFCAIVGERVFRDILAHRLQLHRFFMGVSVQTLMSLIYPVYQVLFNAAVDTSYELPAILLLPVIKLIMKNLAYLSMTHLEDMVPENIVFTVEFFNAMYLATSMQRASSTITVATIMAIDFTQAGMALYGAETVATHSEILGETLATLFTSECIVLTEYLESVIPIFYASFMLIMVHLPSAQYHTELAGITPETVSSTVQAVFLYALLEFVSFAVLAVLTRRMCGLRALYHLAFVLETQMPLIQFKMLGWMLLTLAYRVEHFGTCAYPKTWRFENPLTLWLSQMSRRLQCK